MYLAGSRLVPKIAPKLGACPDLQLTLFLDENGWGRLHSSLVCWQYHTSDMDCTDLQCGTVRVWRDEPEIHSPGGNPCTWPALGYCLKLNRKWRPDQI